MLQGHQTWVFESKPVIIGNAAVGGPFESNCALADDFDMFNEELWMSITLLAPLMEVAP